MVNPRQYQLCFAGLFRLLFELQDVQEFVFDAGKVIPDNDRRLLMADGFPQAEIAQQRVEHPISEGQGTRSHKREEKDFAARRPEVKEVLQQAARQKEPKNKPRTVQRAFQQAIHVVLPDELIQFLNQQLIIILNSHRRQILQA